jgi:hypothetical protein
MEAADSDKDSKSSELTIGPSCIQFRLIIVKVEKFQSAVSQATLVAFPTLPSPSSLTRSPRERMFPFLLPRPVSAFVSTNSGLSHGIGLSRVYERKRERERERKRFPSILSSVYTIKVNFPVPLQRSANNRMTESWDTSFTLSHSQSRNRKT